MRIGPPARTLGAGRLGGVELLELIEQFADPIVRVIGEPLGAHVAFGEVLPVAVAGHRGGPPLAVGRVAAEDERAA